MHIYICVHVRKTLSRAAPVPKHQGLFIYEGSKSHGFDSFRQISKVPIGPQDPSQPQAPRPSCNNPLLDTWTGRIFQSQGLSFSPERQLLHRSVVQQCEFLCTVHLLEVILEDSHRIHLSTVFPVCRQALRKGALALADHPEAEQTVHLWIIMPELHVLS